MKRQTLLTVLLVALSTTAALCFGASAQAQSNDSPTATPAAAAPIASAPIAATAPTTIPGFSRADLDTSVNPCDDFYHYACGGWIKANPIPADQSRWGSFSQLQEANRAKMQAVLENAAANPTPETQKIGDYYAACMDESAIEGKGLAPLQSRLTQIDAIKSKKDLTPLIAQLHQDGVNVFFEFGSDQDAKDSTHVIAEAAQGGIGLPEKDYYFKTDPKSVETRQKYVAHISAMFKLAGEPEDQASKDAATTMAIETALAKGSLDNVSLRNPDNTYHKMALINLQKDTPDFVWNDYLGDVSAPKVASLNVAEPDFFKTVNSVIAQNKLEELKTYLKWHLINASAPVLPKAFVDENFAFNGMILSGQKEIKSRAKRCTALVDGQLGEALGKIYVEQNFPPAAKEKALTMIKSVEAAFEDDIKNLDWMSPATKEKALVKLHAIANKIGYPDHWRDYSSYEIKRDDALGNYQRGNAFELKRQLNKIDKPVDKGEWQMTPPTVNAYYDAQYNDINFPAGVLASPFFDPNADDAVNYGAIGLVMGHEMTHGFDDEGRKFDAQGNLKDWWTKDDAVHFETKAKCLVDQYGGYVAVDDVKQNGKLTLGENTADNGGAVLALSALHKLNAAQSQAAVDGFTPDQRFFLGFARVWCSNTTPENLRLRALTDPHSAGQWRVNGVVSNMASFQKEFSCPATAKMVSRQACRIW